MKTILGLLLTVCSLAAQSLGNPAFVASMTVPSAGGCATTDTAIAHDEFLEGFQIATTGYNDGNAWTQTEVGTTANIDSVFDVSTIFSGVTGACTQGLQVTVPNTTETYAQWDRGSELDLDAAGNELNITLYVYFSTLALSGTESYSMFDINTASATLCTQITLRFDTDHHAISAQGSSESTRVTVTTGVVYKIEIHLDNTTSQCWFDVNDTLGETGTFTRVTARDFQTLRAGGTSGVDGSDGGCVYVFDLICADKL